MMRHAEAADRGLALAQAVTKVTDAIHRMYQNIQVKPGFSYEDEDFAIEISIPDMLCVDEVLDKCHMECIKAEEEFDIYILPKVFCGQRSGKTGNNQKYLHHSATVGAADGKTGDSSAEKKEEHSAAVSKADVKFKDSPPENRAEHSAAVSAVDGKAEDSLSENAAAVSAEDVKFKDSPDDSETESSVSAGGFRKQYDKTENSAWLVVERKRIRSLISACLVLTVLLFAAGFIIGYMGYSKTRMAEPVAQVSLPQHKETRVTWQPDSGAVLKVRKVSPDISDLSLQSETAESVLPAQTAKPAETAKTLLPEKGSFQPFTLRLASYRTKEDALRGLAWFQGKKLSPYLIKIDWGSKGVWWSVYTGHYATQKDAEAAMRALPVSGVLIKEMPYTNFAGLFSNSAQKEDISRRIESVTGYPPYSIAEDGGKIRLFAGSFVTRESAEELNRMLQNNGIKTEVVNR